MTRLLTLAPLAALILFVTAPAAAADIYINGEQVRGITDLTLENCTVTFNKRGDVYITAPDFKVAPAAAKGEEAQEAPSLVEGSTVENRYFLFTQTSSPGKVPYEFEVWVNGKKIKQFASDRANMTVELTLYLQKGDNKVEIRSRHMSTRAGTSADSFTLFIGRGKPVGGSLEINKVLVKYTRLGSDTGDSTDVFHIDAK